MLKYLTHKLRTQSINEDNTVQEKIDSHDSGTESDGELEPEGCIQPEPEIELSMSSRYDTTSPTDTACSSESPAMLGQAHLMYDQHSSEEELEVINGPSSVAAAEAAAAAAAAENILGEDDIRTTATSVISESSSVEPEEPFEESSPKRASSTISESRKRSLAQSSDDEVRNLLESIPAPVNFRTSPPLEALKPNRSHMFRATTPLILTETSRGIESIRISCDNNIINSNNNCNNIMTIGNNCGISPGGIAHNSTFLIGSSGSGLSAILNSNNSVNNSLSTSILNNQQQQQQPALLSPQQHQHFSHINHHHHHHHHQHQQMSNNSLINNTTNNSSCTTSTLAMDVRSVSPPAKLFHCAISPRRRPPRTHHAPQRLQRPHRPCLDFDKMQQLKARSVSAWRHNNEHTHTGELSVFCW